LYLAATSLGYRDGLTAIQGLFGGSAQRVSMLELKQAAQRLGLEVEAWRGDWGFLQRRLRATSGSAILHVNGDHYVVACASPGQGRIPIADPGRGIREFHEETFLATYRWQGDMLLLATGKMPVGDHK